MTSRILRRVAMLAVLPVTMTVALLGSGVASPTSVADGPGCGCAEGPSGGGTLKLVDLGDTARAVTGTSGVTGIVGSQF